MKITYRYCKCVSDLRPIAVFVPTSANIRSILDIRPARSALSEWRDERLVLKALDLQPNEMKMSKCVEKKLSSSIYDEIRWNETNHGLPQGFYSRPTNE